MELYGFHRLKDFLYKRGIRVGQAKGYTPVRAEDVFDQSGNTPIEFSDNPEDIGIYAMDRWGNRHQVYMYKYKFFVTGYEDSIPKYHICKCEVIEQFMEEGRFGEYHYANVEEVDVYDIKPRRVIQMHNLPLCYKCLEKMRKISLEYEIPSNTKRFVHYLRQAGVSADKVELDIFGYPKDWPMVSKRFRMKQNFTCEVCHFDGSAPKNQAYIQVHHRNGDKTNGDDSNLQCLCIACHADVNERHRENFSRGGNYRMLKQFERAFPLVKGRCLYHLSEFTDEQIEIITGETGHVTTLKVNDRLYQLDWSMGAMTPDELLFIKDRLVLIRNDFAKESRVVDPQKVRIKE